MHDVLTDMSALEKEIPLDAAQLQDLINGWTIPILEEWGPAGDWASVSTEHMMTEYEEAGDGVDDVDDVEAPCPSPDGRDSPGPNVRRPLSVDLDSEDEDPQGNMTREADGPVPAPGAGVSVGTAGTMELRMGAVTGTGSDVDSGNGLTSSEPLTDAGTGTHTDTGTGTGTDTNTGIGTGTGIGDAPGTGARTDTGTATGTATRTATDTHDTSSAAQGTPWGGCAHSGVLNGALWLLREVGSCLQILSERGFEVVLTGHSLGGACVTVLAVLLRQFVPGLRAVCFAAPPVVSRDVAESCSDYVLNVVLRDDVIPRASVRNAVHMVEKLACYKDRWRDVFQVAAPGPCHFWFREGQPFGTSTTERPSILCFHSVTL